MTPTDQRPGPQRMAKHPPRGPQPHQRPAMFSPLSLADALGLPAPTLEQQDVIAAPFGPALVVAGAGAGKTETMAARVVYLVANGFAAPDEVLGLTFTRKAAQQLAARIRQRLARLAGAAMIRHADPTGELRTTITTSEPEVSTYHAYAGRLLGEHGLRLPLEPSARLLSQTELWQIAYRVVCNWEGDQEIERSPAAITELVLTLAGELDEHLVSVEDAATAHHELQQLILTLPPGPRQRGAGPSAGLRQVLDAQYQRSLLLPMVVQLREQLRKEGALDFGSQMSLAAQLADRHPEVGAAERGRVRAVLLDEYQDTGHSQRVLLSALFGRDGHPDLTVTAVGDPIQSIYGWRGASANNLNRFVTDFPQPGGAPAPRLELLTSWRNPVRALDVANAVSAPVRQRGVPVSTLRPKPGAADGDVRLALLGDVAEERRWLADRIAAEYAAALDLGQAPPSTAVLVRRNSDSAPIAEELRDRGLPVEVVGLGGLLDTPEVRDLVAMLRLMADPMAGSAAMRVLTGARWRIGAADIAVLWRRANELAIMARRGLTGTVEDTATLNQALLDAIPGESAEQAGIGDAIADPGPADRYSPEGARRIAMLGAEVRALRRRMGQPLTELVADVERTLRLGMEAEARGGGIGREHLDAFADVVAGYTTHPAASLTGFLAFLAAAEKIEKGLAPGEVAVDPTRVQILTMHSAKGLEWQVVAVPHLVEGVFPSSTASSTWLRDPAQLPAHLRGDKAEPGGAEPGAEDGVPVLDLATVTHRKDLEDALDRHKEAFKTRGLEEERRLLYVALTRTEHALYLSGHHWSDTGEKPRGPSAFLTELKALVEAHCGESAVQWAPDPEPGDENPLTATPRTASWPVDPLGARRVQVAEGAALVRAQLRRLHLPPDDPAVEEDPDGWAADVVALLAERDRLAADLVQVPLPRHLSVSNMVALAEDPDELALRLRRPVPFAPNPLARRGTAFHAWLERRFGATRLLDLDELPGAADTGASSDADLDLLQRKFLQSAWADRAPHEVEVPFEASIGDTVVRGRIDAVFRDPDGGWTVVDWKTGKVPDAEHRRAVAMQLAAYRVAWAELVGARGQPVPLEKVRAAFHYVRHNVTVAPADLPGAAELREFLEKAGRAAAPDTPPGGAGQ